MNYPNLERRGILVYDTPAPHVLWEDVKLALGPELYTQFSRLTVNLVGADGVAAESLEKFLSKHLY